MEKERIEIIRERVISLIESEYESDASFERAVGLPEKTVNNWRRGRSSSFMHHLPELSDYLGITVGELMDIPVGQEGELSEDELEQVSGGSWALGGGLGAATVICAIGLAVLTGW
jgi:bacteriocin-like protein